MMKLSFEHFLSVLMHRFQSAQKRGSAIVFYKNIRTFR